MKNKQIKLKEFHQTDGQVIDNEFEATTIAQVLGSDNGISKYGTMDITTYEASLREMNKSDLYTHASHLGIMPSDDRQRLTRRLVEDFKIHIASFRVPKAKKAFVPKITPELEKILATGR